MAKGMRIGYTDNIARIISSVYLGLGVVELSNLAPAITAENGFFGTVVGNATTRKYSGYSLQADATASDGEVTITTTDSFPLISSHKYYARVEVYQSTVVGKTSLYWPIAEPVFYNNKTAQAGQWTICSAINTRSSFTDGSYQIRLDFDNNYKAGQMLFDGLMLIDLTTCFGSGYEPAQAWCDANIPYFTGSTKIIYSGVTPKARTIIKAYMGDDDGIARLCFPGVVHSWAKYEAKADKVLEEHSSTLVLAGTRDVWFVDDPIIEFNPDANRFVFPMTNSVSGATFYESMKSDAITDPPKYRCITQGGVWTTMLYITSADNPCVYNGTNYIIDFDQVYTIGAPYKGDYVETVTDTDETAYPDNGYQGGYWYVKISA